MDLNTTNRKNIKIKKMTSNAMIPTHGSGLAAGYDIYSNNTSDITIPAHTTIKIGTGISMELPEGYFGAIFPRSGLATKEGLRMANCVAVIDEDYRGEWCIPLHNDSNQARVISPNQRIAQFVLLPYQCIEFEEVDVLSETDRGINGFGSTGK